MEKKEEIGKSNLKQGNISLILDSYDDIFSDFDPRSYSNRALSDDFLLECKKAARSKKEGESGLELRLLMPPDKRNTDDEVRIEKRLKNHFKKHFEEKQREMKRATKNGIVWFIAGISIILAATSLSDYRGFLFRFLFVLLEPAGWFTTWAGLDKIFIEPRGKRPEFEFYRKMADIQIIFLNY